MDSSNAAEDLKKKENKKRKKDEKRQKDLAKENPSPHYSGNVKSDEGVQEVLIQILVLVANCVHQHNDLSFISGVGN